MRLLLSITASIFLCMPAICAQTTDSITSIEIVDLQTTPTEEVKEKQFYEGGPLSHLNVSVGVSTLGLGLEAATPLNSYFKLRAGINYMGYTTKDFDISLDDGNDYLTQAIGYVPDYRMKGKLNFTNGHVLVDFHPVKKGIFHLTTGFYIGANKLKANGYLIDNNGDRASLIPGEDWPILDFDGYELNIDNGDLNAELTLGQTIKPYVGLGFGRAISKSRVSFKFEMGAMYQGDYTLKQNGKEVELIETDFGNFEDIDDYKKILRWWPMLNFQLTYRIF